MSEENRSRTLKVRRGTAEQVQNMVFESGEIVLDMTNMRLVVGDGHTKGGVPMAKLEDTTKKGK